MPASTKAHASTATRPSGTRATGSHTSTMSTFDRVETSHRETQDRANFPTRATLKNDIQKRRRNLLIIASVVLLLATLGACYFVYSSNGAAADVKSDPESPMYHASSSVMCGKEKERSRVQLQCSSGTISDIEFASYGTPSGDCGNSFRQGSCHSSKSESELRSRCVGKQSCSVDASNSIFGDPCKGTKKYLAAKIRCSGDGSGSNVNSNSGTKVCKSVAERATLSLECSSGQISSVDFASYGLPSGSCGSFSKGGCHSSRSESVVREKCVGRSSCSVSATNDIFNGDPCYGRKKKLSVQVRCTGGDNGNQDNQDACNGINCGSHGSCNNGKCSCRDNYSGNRCEKAPDNNPPPSSSTSSELVGWAAQSGSTTGGGNAKPVTVKSYNDLKKAVGNDKPKVVIVSGTISGTGVIPVGSHTTIRGADKNAKLHGSFSVKNKNNVIITNLKIQGYWPKSAPADCLEVRNSHHLWFDHLELWDAPDGLLDMTRGCDYATVSWTKFWYTDTSHGHRLACLCSGGSTHGDTDSGKMRVTYHHNWFYSKVRSRQPRYLFGKGHIFNNYYSAKGNNYCVGVGVFASVVVENNYFKDVNKPHVYMYPDKLPSYITARNNIYDHTSGAKNSGECKVSGQKRVSQWTPSYNYKLDNAKDIPNIVMKNAGPQ